MNALKKISTDSPLNSDDISDAIREIQLETQNQYIKKNLEHFKEDMFQALDIFNERLKKVENKLK